jgi:hypothetical protein
MSYFIGANLGVGVTLAARYAGNSEAISRSHYLASITEQNGARWFGIRRGCVLDKRRRVSRFKMAEFTLVIAPIFTILILIFLMAALGQDSG